LSVPEATIINHAIAQYVSRTIDVELTSALTFRMLEARFAPRLSHWSRIWPSAIALSRWLLHEPHLALSSTELGCGLGLVSMTLAHRGVVVEGTDRVSHALAFAAHNAAQNDLTGFSVSLLDWGEPTGVPSSLVVGSDILYDPSAPDRLFALLDTSGLLIPGGKLVIAGPRARSILFDVFRKKLSAEGYVHSEEACQVEWEGRTEAIDVHLLMRP